MIAAGQTSVKFDVTIVDDNTVENNETFTLRIRSTLLPDRISIGSIQRTTVTIVDNDG